MLPMNVFVHQTSIIIIKKRHEIKQFGKFNELRLLRDDPNLVSVPHSVCVCEERLVIAVAIL